MLIEQVSFLFRRRWSFLLVFRFFLFTSAIHEPALFGVLLDVFFLLFCDFLILVLETRQSGLVRGGQFGAGFQLFNFILEVWDTMSGRAEEERGGKPRVSFLTKAKSRALDLSALFYYNEVHKKTSGISARKHAFLSSFLRWDFPERNGLAISGW